MGRGRQKAKQTKVARELKYYTQETNFSQLERELRGETGPDTADPDATADDDDYEDRYAAWADIAFAEDDDEGDNLDDDEGEVA